MNNNHSSAEFVGTSKTNILFASQLEYDNPGNENNTICNSWVRQKDEWDFVQIVLLKDTVTSSQNSNATCSP